MSGRTGDESARWLGALNNTCFHSLEARFDKHQAQIIIVGSDESEQPPDDVRRRATKPPYYP